MVPDLAVRLVPMAAVVGAVQALWRPAWLGLSGGLVVLQLATGLAGLALMFAGGAAVQRGLSRRRGSLRVPAGPGDAAWQGVYYLLNAPLEEAFFRGLIQGGVGSRAGAWAGLAAGASAYVLYHRLGRWPWPDVMATALVALPLGAAFALLPGPPSILAVSLAHAGATCGFLGPGPWLLRRLGLL